MTERPNDFADSTIAMTIYNMLNMLPPMTLEELQPAAMKLQHIGLGLDQTQRAVDGLMERGRIVQGDDGKYGSAAREKLMVVTRDLSDYNDQKMTGGWEGWRVKDPRIRDGIGTRPLEHVLLPQEKVQ